MPSKTLLDKVWDAHVVRELEDGRTMSRVGMMWSTVPKVRDGKRTFQPRSRSSSNACGVVTS